MLRRQMFIPISIIFTSVSTLSQAGPANAQHKIFAVNTIITIPTTIVIIVITIVTLVQNHSGADSVALGIVHKLSLHM